MLPTRNKNSLPLKLILFPVVALLLTAFGNSPTIEPYAGAPECPTHDPEKWHGLWDAERGCHYDHEHKHDPNEVNHIFGQPGCWFGACGQEISYPWQTFAGANTEYAQWSGDSADLENSGKHRVYGWIVRQDIPSNGRAKWMRAFRLQFHAMSQPPGSLTRFHSFSIEAEVCEQSGQCGIVRTGGWLDFGNLEVRGVPIPQAGEADAINDSGRRRIHFYYDDAERRANGLRAEFFWYGRLRPIAPPFIGPLDPMLVALGMSDVAYNPNPKDVSNPNGFFCLTGDTFTCDKNDSTIQAHFIQFNVRTSDFSGYTDRYGLPAGNCAEAGLDCVPLILEHVPTGNLSHRDDRDLGLDTQGLQDFDVSPAGEWWIKDPTSANLPPQPTATSQPSPTLTPTPIPTLEPSATPVPTEVSGPRPDGLPYDGAPLCPDHSPTKWHGLWDAERGCHYDHEHKHDPNEVNDIFGQPGCWFSACGQEISYPWETFSGASGDYPAWSGNPDQLENNAKHTNYGWLVRRDIAPHGNAPNFIKAFRWQFHAKGSASAVGTRFHSFSLEAQICERANPSNCGIARTAGWLDFGNLEVKGNVIPNPSELDAVNDDGRRRIHFEHPTNLNRCPGNFNNSWFWYGRFRPVFDDFSGPFSTGILASLAQNDSVSNIMVNNSSANNPFCDVADGIVQGPMNGTTIAAHVLDFQTNADGLQEFSGYTDRYGLDNTANCSAPGLDCIPSVISNVPPGKIAQYRDDAHGLSGASGVGDIFDMSPAAIGTGNEWWVTYEN